MPTTAGRRAGEVRVSIYALLDPRHSPPSVRYVGCTRGSVDTRLSMHISEAVRGDTDRPKDEWVRELIREGLEPTYQLLERVYDVGIGAERERYWITRYRTPLLTNIASGGPGSPDSPRSAYTKKRLSEYHKGVPLTEEHRQKISAAKLGHVVSEETRQKLRAVNLGRTHSEDTKQKHRDAMQGFKHTAEARAKISATRKERIAAKLITMPHAAGSAAAAAKISGSMWINDGTQNKRVPQGTPLPLGWSQGRALSARQSEMYSQRRKANNPEN